MRSGGRGHLQPKEAGFSLVEMMMTACVLAVGLLGLTMLQVMSLKASRGSRSLSTAIMVADRIMDQVEIEGRLSWLNLTDTNRAAVNLAGDLPNLRYISTDSSTVTDGLVEYFNNQGDVTTATASDRFFTVTTKRVAATAVQTGRISDVTVRVQFVDDVNGSHVAIPREVSLVRRIVHG